VVLFASCEKENNNEPLDIPDEIVGDWVNESLATWPQQDEIISFNFNKIDLLNGSFDFLWIKEYPEENHMTVVAAAKGTFVFKSNKLIFTPTEFGSEIHPDTFEILDTTKWYTSNDPEFQLFEFFPPVKYECQGNSLILKVDDNNDGDYDDDGETIVFLRK
jgi:hypothetical protein